MLVPVLSEKSIRLAKEGWYTFRGVTNYNKSKVKAIIEKLFDVTVDKVRKIKIRGKGRSILVRKGGRWMRGRKKTRSGNMIKYVVHLSKGIISDFDVK